MKRNRRFYCYKVTRISTGQYYIGKRTCECDPEEDVSYMGSGVVITNMLKHVDRSDFRKEILGEYQDNKSCLEAETKFISDKYLKDDLCLNRTSGGEGVVGFKHREDSLSKMRSAKLGRVLSESQRNKISESGKLAAKRQGRLLSDRMTEMWKTRSKEEASKNFKSLWEDQSHGKKMKFKGWSSNPTCWLMAQEAYEIWVSDGSGYKSISKKLGIEMSENMIYKFKGGWIPLEDPHWVEWRNYEAKS